MKTFLKVKPKPVTPSFDPKLVLTFLNDYLLHVCLEPLISLL